MVVPHWLNDHDYSTQMRICMRYFRPPSFRGLVVTLGLWRKALIVRPLSPVSFGTQTKILRALFAPSTRIRSFYRSHNQASKFEISESLITGNLIFTESDV